MANLTTPRLDEAVCCILKPPALVLQLVGGGADFFLGTPLGAGGVSTRLLSIYQEPILVTQPAPKSDIFSFLYFFYCQEDRILLQHHRLAVCGQMLEHSDKGTRFRYA